VALSCLVLCPCWGCPSYFRTGERLLLELVERNREAQKEKNMFFQPGDILYSK